MSRETSPYVVGDFWLDKRRDGKSPYWQIASYKPASRSVGYRSTHCRVLDDAKAVIHAHEAAARAKRPQRAEEAKVIPLLALYWEEHGKKVVSPSQIASSIRAFIGFFMQDEVTADVTVDQITPQMFVRFREWRMAAHSYDVPWGEKAIQHASKGVSGETVQRNLDDFRAALSHHANNGRLPYAPKVPAVTQRFRSKPRDRVLSDGEIGAIVGFTRGDKIMHRWVLTMLATAARPIAAMKLDPARQYDAKRGLIDLHPPGDPQTKKQNPVLPVIPEFAPVLAEWTAEGAGERVRSRRTAWHTMRRCLGFGLDVVPKTIRHTVATRMRALRVPPHEISEVLGHATLNRTTAVYAKYDPDYLDKAKSALSMIWQDAMASADKWDAVHLRSKKGNDATIVVDKKPEKAQIHAA